MTEQRQALGLLGERLAARWLLRAGWTFVAHRYRVGRRDLDLIMQRGTTIAFVEVKARRGAQFGSPIEAVDPRKQRALSQAAAAWVDRCGAPGWSYQFDVVGVLISGERVRIRHISDAFSVKMTE
ncbi:MAG: YraN family protein [Gemmatimonadaceae bacterium]